MQHFSFDFGDPMFDLSGWRIGAQVITFENTYGLDPAATRLSTADGCHRIIADQLMWAGNQEKAAGRATVSAVPTGDGLELIASAMHTRKIRCTKLIVRGLPPATTLIGDGWRASPIGQGRVLRYPPRVSCSVENLHTPLIFLETPDGETLYFRALDTRVREKRFAVYPSPLDGGLTVELIHEDLGPDMTVTTTTPPWRIGRTRDPDAVVADHLRHLEASFGLTPWASNPRVPAWMREIALVAYIHGQHWTGHIFNDYDAMLRALQVLAARIEGRRILAHLAGWEGRYYWKYGDFTPDPRMGGAAAFKRLCDGARALGVRVQLMLGGNCANVGLPGFWQWGETSYLRTAGGAVDRGNSPDWDGSRAHDTPWQAWLNPGAPGWHNHLLEQAAHLVEAYGVDAIFLDTHGVWQNDPNHLVYDGLLRLRDQLAARFPEVFLTGEIWWDALGAVTPLSQSDWMTLERWPELFTRYTRTFGNNTWGDPSRNSSGVFEGGFRPFQIPPEAAHLIPTLTIVDGTLDKAPAQVDAVLEQARRYASRYLGG
ncbi:MAG: hypothetical protein QM820_44520 [Minicystis sp.]